MSINEDIKYLEENYGHKFPKIAKYKRTANRIYTIMDFMDGDTAKILNHAKNR